MIEFDNIITEACENPSSETDPTTCLPSGGVGPGGGVIPPVPPVDDDRCADPAFYNAHPEICAGYPHLILKPEVAITETGKTVQYATYLRTNGNELLVSNGLTYHISNPTIAWIDPAGGLATGVAVGSVTVSVKWQNLSAFAILEVVAACSDLNNSYLILIDNSKSMSQGFSDTFSTKLTFSKDAAKGFINTTNFTKDSVAVAEFGQGGTIVTQLTQSASVALAGVQSIVPTTEKTNMDDGLKTAIDYLNSNASGTKIIIMFSDGENTGPDPKPRADAFKSAGNILVVIGTRCWGQFFDLLYKMATAGFFLSAYQDTESDVETTLDDLKSYICSGSCTPTPGTYPHAQLDYYRFVNWDVDGEEDSEVDPDDDNEASDYRVDLCGLGLYDLWPGHGLYVDMSGSTNTKFHIGSGSRLTSKVQFALVAGHQYTFKIKIAGNNRKADETNKPIRVTIGGYLDEAITPTSWDMPFTQFSFTFTPGTSTSENIVIEQIIASGVRDTSFGTWIDEIDLEDITTSTQIFFDDFDDENPVTIPTDSYFYGYGCIVTPPGAQSADPTPPETMME